MVSDLASSEQLRALMGLDAVQFVMMLEDAFGIEIPDRDAADLETVGQWHAYLVGRLPQLGADAIWTTELDVLCSLLRFDEAKRANVKRTDHIVQDLGFT